MMCMHPSIYISMFDYSNMHDMWPCGSRNRYKNISIHLHVFMDVELIVFVCAHAHICG